MNCSIIDHGGLVGHQPQGVTRRQFIVSGTLALALPGQIHAQTDSQSGQQHALLYWGAHDCGPCLAWERDHLSRVQDELAALKVRVLVLKKPRIVDPWTAEHVQAETLALNIFRSGGAPRLTPHFTYVADGLRLIDVPGYNRGTWASVHQRAVDRLFRKRP